MKKISLFVVMVVCALVARATDYPYLVFTNTAGTTTLLSVSNMTLNAIGTTLDVSNADGTTSFTLTDLANMQFSKDGSTVTALENVLDADKAVEVFSLSGMRLGSYENLMKAVTTLKSGVYVISDGKYSQKVVVK
ncbi:MAG: hypothetical protein IJS05_07270 [Paludibacteraceae bacterium]|nr:hypothetical protein [Paludibacteraceae bacterium]